MMMTTMTIAKVRNLNKKQTNKKSIKKKLCNNNCYYNKDDISSEEEEVDEFSSEYYEQLGNYSKRKMALSGLDMKKAIKDSVHDDDDDEEEETIDDLNETALEGFSTTIDNEEDENAIDEYVIFKEVITGKSNHSHTFVLLERQLFAFSLFVLIFQLYLPVIQFGMVY